MHFFGLGFGFGFGLGEGGGGGGSVAEGGGGGGGGGGGAGAGHDKRRAGVHAAAGIRTGYPDGEVGPSVAVHISYTGDREAVRSPASPVYSTPRSPSVARSTGADAALP